MSIKKDFNPNFHTPKEKFCKEELNKLASNGGRGNLLSEFRNELPDLTWESEQLAKSQGIYLEFNRAQTGEEKDWMYMLRVSVIGGGPLTRTQWNLIDELSEKYTEDKNGHPSIRFTTRQNIQFHWVKKPQVIEIIKRIAESGWNTLNGCGDNTRNTMSCPLSGCSNVFNATTWAHRVGRYFQLPMDAFIEIFSIDPNYIRRPEESFQYGPNLLNRKFKIGFSTVHRDPASGILVPDNCVEMRTNDLGIAPYVKNNKLADFQVYVGGGQGERNGKPTMNALSLPLCICSEEQLLPILDAVVQVHQEWGDRENRHWARMKYVVKKLGIDWYRDQVSVKLGVPLQRPDTSYDIGARDLHFGWSPQSNNGLLAYGMFIENGRISDYSPHGKIKTMLRELMNKYPIELMITPNQDALLTNIPIAAKTDFESDIKKFGYGKANGKPFSQLRLLSGACVGRDTCRLTYTDSEKFEPRLIDELEKLGWGNMQESIGITGCERQCFRPSTKTIGLVGSGLNRYQLRLGGSEDARFQGGPLISSDGENMYLRSIPKEKVVTVINALFKFYKANTKPGEDMGRYHRRIGPDAIIKYLKENPATAELLEKPAPTDCVIE